MMMPEFSIAPGTKVSYKYASQIFFFTLQAHTAMGDFTEKKFTGHGLLGNTFIWFLARQCGNSSAAVFDARLIAVEKKVKDVHKRVEDEATAAKRKAGKATPTP
jgi:hypothetical protein